jgi:hypothetical protein
MIDVKLYIKKKQRASEAREGRTLQLERGVLTCRTALAGFLAHQGWCHGNCNRTESCTKKRETVTVYLLKTKQGSRETKKEKKHTGVTRHQELTRW